jgi:cytoskeletal protein CcmA (bactofilin family)
MEAAMRSKWRVRAIGVVAGLSLLACATWAAAAIDAKAGDEVRITGTSDQLVLAAGEDVTLELTATDDVAAAGGDVTAQNATFDHVFLAGGDISFTGSTARDIFAAGGEIDVVSGQVLDDLIAAGGRITVGRDARVNGDAVVTGGRIRLEGVFGGEVRAAGGSIYIDGDITGDVNLDGRSITIGPNAHIHGALTHRGRSVTIAPEAQIDGQTTALRPRPEIDTRPLAAFGVWMAASVLFGLSLMAVVIALVFPRLMDDVADIVQRKPVSMLALGFAIALLTPMAIVLLMVTILGLPLAFLIAMAFALLWPVSLVGAVYAASIFVRGRVRNAAGEPSRGARALWAGLAMVVFILLGFIPFVGFLIWVLAYFVGLGAVVLQAGRALSKPAAAPAVA